MTATKTKKSQRDDSRNERESVWRVCLYWDRQSRVVEGNTAGDSFAKLIKQ